MTLFNTFFALIAFALLLAVAKADLPVHCLPDDAAGKWTFFKGPAGQSAADIRGKCDFNSSFEIKDTITIELQNPNIAIDSATGARGVWTNIYDQGFEVTINGVVYYAFYQYEKQGSKVVSNCGKTFTGAFHDEGVAAHGTAANWGCYRAVKEKNTVVEYDLDDQLMTTMASKVFSNNAEYIERLNKAQSSWIAGPAPKELEGKSMEDIFRISGSTNRVNKFKKERTRAYFEKLRARRHVQLDNYVLETLPGALDWRNVSGESFVTPVRNQGSCGSCWIFGSASSYQDRLMVTSKRQLQYTLSTQNIADCSMENPQYGQSCDGGFPYLAAKWVHDFGGVTHESCYPYKAHDQKCQKVSCDKPNVYIKSYKYVGGFYGGANEADMIADVVENGPSVVGIQVYNDFFHYRGGVYHHVSSQLDEEFVGRWEEINHAVELVGYGVVESTGEKYWIIKNSWGESWGLNGYAMIRRGTDEIGIESCVVSAIPYV